MRKILILLSAAVLFSCENEDQLGPDIEGFGAEPVPVGVFESSVEEVDFTVGETIFFTQSFENPTQWTLSLVGMNSGATKTFTSVTDALTETNTSWDGVADASPFFQAEKVIATVSFPGFPNVASLVDTFTITKVNGALIQSVLFTDFSVSPVYPFGGQVPAGGGWGSDWPTTNNTNTAYPLYDANAYLFIEGAPWQANNPYVDITEMPANVGDTLSDTHLPLFSDPERVYINLAVYNTGTEDTWLQLQMMEDVGAGVARSWDIRPDWIGWKNIAIKYSDLSSDNTSAYDPTNVKQINLILLSDQDVTETPQNTVSVAIDQLVFSFDSPLGSIN